MFEYMELVRLEKGVEGCFGVLRMDGEVFCVTLEPPDLDNAVGASCIPAGRYRCTKVESPRFGSTYEVQDVPGRTNILFHAGNVASDTRGCVLLGRRFGELGGQRGILNSGGTVQEFLARLTGGADFELTIQEVEAA